MAKYRDYTDEDIIKAAAEVYSMAGLLRRLGLKEAGGNYINMKRNLQRLGLQCEHWTKQGWNKDQQLKDWSEYTRAASRRKQLINRRGNICEKCGLSDWQGDQIPLELHHLDGDRTNNELNNLVLYCCNCHAQTDNYRNKKRVPKEKSLV